MPLNTRAQLRLSPSLILCLLAGCGVTEGANDSALPLEQTAVGSQHDLQFDDEEATPVDGSTAVRDTIWDRLTAEGYEVLGVQVPPMERILWYSKVTAIGPEGELVVFATDRAGNTLSAEQMVELRTQKEEAAFQRSGTMAPESYNVIRERHDLDDFDIIFYPELNLPAEPDPKDMWGLGPEEGDLIWQAHYATLQEVRENARAELKKQIPDYMEVGEDSYFGFVVNVQRKDVEEAIRLPNVMATKLAPRYFGPSETANAHTDDLACNFDVLREDEGALGDGNGYNIEVGMIELSDASTGVRIAHPSPAITDRDYEAGPACCVVDGDCVNGGTCQPDLALDTSCWTGNTCTTNGHAATTIQYLGKQYANGDFAGAPTAEIVIPYDRHGPGMDYVAAQAAHIANRSLQNGAGDRIENDSFVRDDNVAFFHSAGNEGAADFPPPSPNMITVSTSNTAMNALGNDVSSLNRPNMDRESPDLATIGSATSWSSPRAAAMAVILHDYSKMADGMTYSTWENYPEATKALMMAAATSNADGGNISNHGFAGFDPDERDGAGVVDVQDIKDIFNLVGDDKWSIVRHNHTAGFSTSVWRTVDVPPSSTMRVVMAWSRCPSDVDDDQHVDYGLSIENVDSGQVTVPYDSYDGTWEIAEVTNYAPVTQTYDVSRRQWQGAANCNGSSSDIVALAVNVY